MIDQPEQAAVVIEVRVADHSSVDCVDVVLPEEWSNHVTSGVEVARPSGRIRFRWITYAGVIKVSMAVWGLQKDARPAPRSISFISKQVMINLPFACFAKISEQQIANGTKQINRRFIMA
jgi:hypothetical protein